jgi:hypothetical protein
MPISDLDREFPTEPTIEFVLPTGLLIGSIRHADSRPEKPVISWVHLN